MSSLVSASSLVFSVTSSVTVSSVSEEKIEQIIMPKVTLMDYVKGQGIVLNEPSVVAIDTETKKPLAVGMKAREMLGRTPLKMTLKDHF